MPLRAVTPDGEDVISTDLGDETWSRLRAAPDRGGLRMPDTGAPAVPKVSPNGLRFFAHRAGTAPPGGAAGETPLHLELKRRVIAGARRAGWNAVPEAADPHGGTWRADVLCSRGAARVAIELQVSHQKEVDYAARQARYAADRIRCLWLEARPHSYRARFGTARPTTEATEDLPIFRIWTPPKSARPTAEDTVLVAVDGVELPLEDFVAGALSGSLRWIGPKDTRVGAFLANGHTCWKCGAPMLWVLSFEPEMGAGYRLAVEAFWPNPTIRQLYRDLRIRHPDVPPIEVRYSKTIRRERATATCPGCGSIQGAGHQAAAERHCIPVRWPGIGTARGWTWGYAQRLALAADGVGQLLSRDGTSKHP